MLGKLLDGRYHINQVLGAGGFGRTYIAQDTRRPGNPTCVVKQLKPANNDPGFLETARRLFNSEAETLEQLGNHDQIPRLLAYFEEDREFYLVQEFIEGHPLSQELLPGQRWDENRVIELLQEVLTILDFVHRHGVIHRDIKPDNLIRRHCDRKLVLVDFGAVKQIRTQLASNYGQVSNTVAVGTPGYMSSEQALGQPRPSSDIYALGIIGIQALTGMMPTQFQEDLQTGEILWQHLAPVSRGLATILTKMVRYHFKDRYQSVGEVLQALQQFKADPASYSATTPAYSSVRDVQAAGSSLPAPNYSNPLSEKYTMAAAPSAGVRQPVASSSSAPAVAQPYKSDKLPILLGISMAFAVGVGMAYASSQGLFSGIGNLISDRNQMGSCKVVAGVLNVRSEPGGSVLDTVTKGTSLALTGKEQKDWVEINSPMKGWVFNDSQYIDCNSATPTIAQTEPSPTPVKTQPSPTPDETPTPTTEKSPDQPKPVDNSAKILAKAAEKYQQGKLDEAIADAQSVLPDSPAFKDAQDQIEQWQQEWSDAKAKFERIEQAYKEGRYIDVLIYASDSNFPEQRYWREKLNQLVQDAMKRKDEAESNPEVSPSPEQSDTQQPAPEPQQSVQPSQETTDETSENR
ncbi:MAG TPA: serine/threonine protein kinase [Cyanobacteria bacterium UBA8803]|nr:serine/threonine protein kinase [Cyanobacteria bacterium UBA9273]HBL57913.1 serine/threonine protein kinase [Cyanobacteria bacterium UBA8803]